MFIGVALLGALGSGIPAINARRRRVQREKSVEDLNYLFGLSDLIFKENDPLQVDLHLKEVDAIFQRSLVACAEGHVSSGTLVAIQAAVNRCHRSAELNVAL